MSRHVRSAAGVVLVLVVVPLLAACDPPPPPPPCIPKTGIAFEERFDVDPVVPGYSTETVIQAGGTSGAFDGGMRQLVTPLVYGDVVTVEAFIKPTSVSGQQIIWDDYGSPGVLLQLLPAPGGPVVVFAVSTVEHPGVGASVSAPIEIGKWQHVAGVYDGAELRIYINGAAAVETTPTSGAILEAVPTPGFPYAAIGANNNIAVSGGYVGLLDDLRVYDKVLTVEELGIYDIRACTLAV